MAAFKASARSLDQGVGAVLDVLEETGLADDTLVLLTTDHGLAFPGAKATLYDRGLGVMLIVRGPGGFSGGKVIDAMVTHLDIFPTLCELAGVPLKPWLQGSSLLPLLEAPGRALHQEIFAGATWHAAYEPQRAVRTLRWKYIRRFGDRDLPVLANCDDSPSKDVLLRHGWGERRLPREQLYDLVFDPNEAANLADRGDAQPVLDDLRRRLDEWMAATADPLLDGDVEPPQGVELNDPDQRSARTPPDPRRLGSSLTRASRPRRPLPPCSGTPPRGRSCPPGPGTRRMSSTGTAHRRPRRARVKRARTARRRRRG